MGSPLFSPRIASFHILRSLKLLRGAVLERARVQGFTLVDVQRNFIYFSQNKTKRKPSCWLAPINYLFP